eukprot:82473-Rhodomonas_salina.2
MLDLSQRDVSALNAQVSALRPKSSALSPQPQNLTPHTFDLSPQTSDLEFQTFFLNPTPSKPHPQALPSTCSMRRPVLMCCRLLPESAHATQGAGERGREDCSENQVRPQPPTLTPKL